jgi:hypothetical protein
MAAFVPPEQCTFSLEGDEAVIRLSGVTVDATEGWSLLNRRTLVVVDGPGEEGFLLRRAGADGRDAAPSGWDATVAATHGAWMDLPAVPVRLRAALIDE